MTVMAKYFINYVLACAAFLLMTPFCALAAVDKYIYLSPSGDDRSSGFTSQESVFSLQHAFDVAMNLPGNKVASIVILADSGVYKKQKAVIKGAPDGVTIQVRPMNPKKPRPRFDGDGSGGTWLVINSSSGTPSNIGIYGLEIVNFETAISINGSRGDFSRSNGGNIIRNNVFNNIGQISSEAAKPSTAVIRLVNSDGNMIVRNKFYNMRNRESCVLLHAIYVAHNSTDNLIEENVFEYGCGDAIRFRDESGNNVVRRNKFKDAWHKAPVSDWYCDGSSRDDCTKAEGECPSLDNLLIGNEIYTNSGSDVPKVLVYGRDASQRCPKSASRERFIVR